MGLLSYYYLKSFVDSSGKTRIRPLSGQKLGLKSSGVWIDSTKNVACEKDSGIRTKYKIGTVFACKQLEDSGRGFYKVPDWKIYPIEESGMILDILHDGTTRDMISDYKNFLAERGESKEVFTKDDFTEIDTSSGDKGWLKTKGKKTGESKEETKPVKVPDEDGKVEYPKLIQRLGQKKSISPPDIEKDGFYIDKDIWLLLIRNVRYRKNTMMLGDSGTGKTEAVYWLAKKLKKNIAVYDMGAMLDPLSGLLGTHRIKNKESIFDYAAFVYSVQQPNIVLLDELNRAPVTTNNILFPCLDSRRELPVDIADMEGSRRIKIHPDCVFFATANVGAEYTGTGIIDRALMERFFPVEVKYLPKMIESKVLVSRTGVDLSMAELICEYAQRIRDIYKRGELSIGVSIRHTLEVASMVVDGFKLSDALEYVFLPTYEGTKTSGERAVIAAIISSK